MTDAIFADAEFLAQGAPAPGRWEPNQEEPGMIGWSGQTSWMTQNGEAVVYFLLGRPILVAGARLPDGSALPLVNSCRIDGIWRRPNPEGEGYLLGTIDIRDEGVSFNPRPADPKPTSEGVGPDLRGDLLVDPEFMEEIKDRNTAIAVYLAFCNLSYMKNGANDTFDISWRTSGGFVADARGINETYMDFYCSNIDDIHPPTGQTFEDEASRLDAWFLGVVARLGWRRVEDRGIA